MEKKLHFHQKLVKIGILLFLFSFLSFQLFRWKEFNPLNGIQVVQSEHLKDSLKQQLSFLNGTKQKYYELKMNEELVLKSPLVKLRNQLQYSFFEKINAHDIYQYNNNLFRFYTSNYNESTLFRGEAEITEKIRKLSEIQAFLGKEIPVFTLIAPSKADYNPAYLPAKHKTTSKKTNYFVIRKKLQEANLNWIDFNQYFKNYSSSVPIIGKGGIHWSSFASCIAMDSLVKRVSQLKKVSFHQPNWTLEKTFKEDYNDQDLAELLNVFLPPLDKNLRNVTFLPVKKDSKKIKALVISDSFFDVISRKKLRSQIFTKDTKYWYYFKNERITEKKTIPIDKSSLLLQMKSVDCIIILSDVVNLENFAWGFIEEAYEQILDEKKRH